MTDGPDTPQTPARDDTPNEEFGPTEAIGQGGYPEESPADTHRAVEASRRTQERTESQELYWRAFERLQQEHPKEAGAWELYHHQDVEDHEECARRLNISVVNSYKRVSRAQSYLRLYLLDLMQEGGQE